MYVVAKDKSLIDKRSIPEPNSGCWLWIGGTSKRGYGIIGARPHNLGAHRLSYELYKGPIPEGMMVLHKCDVPSCVNPDHLFVGTQSDNLRDMHTKGRGRAKLTPDQVRDIRSRPKYRGLIADLAAEFGMQPEHMSGVRNGRSWNFLRTEKKIDKQEKTCRDICS